MSSDKPVRIQQAPWMLHLGVAGDLVTALCEVALSVLFYVLLWRVDRTVALLSATFRLAFTVAMIANVPNLLSPLRLLADEPYLTTVAPGAAPALALAALDAYRQGYALALLFLAAHILLLGYLLYRSGYVPKLLLGGWLVVGSTGLFVYLRCFPSHLPQWVSSRYAYC